MSIRRPARILEIPSTPVAVVSPLAVKAAPAGKWHLPVLWATCLLTLTVSLVSAVPILTINAVNTNMLGSDLLSEVAKQQFYVLYASIQSALDEADYWMDNIDGYLKRTPYNVTAKVLEPHLKTVMLPWLSTVAKRVGGVCTEFVSDYTPHGGWAYCASRLDLTGERELFWEWMPNDTMQYKTRVDLHGNLLDVVDSWPAYLPDHPVFQMQWAPDGTLVWLPPWIWQERRGDGTVFTFTEVGQRRMVRAQGARVLNFLWMQDVDWAKLLRVGLARTGSQAGSEAVAFLFDRAGLMIATTAGASYIDAKLIPANASDSPVVRETFTYLQSHDLFSDLGAFLMGNVGGSTYFISCQQVSTSKGALTPYFLVLSYPFSAVDQPLRRNLYTLVMSSVASLCVISLVACLLANKVIVVPLRALASDMYRCVELNLASAGQRAQVDIREFYTIFDSFDKMKCMLESVTKFLPLEIVQQALRESKPMNMSMTRAEASVFFLGVDNMTILMETMEIEFLVGAVSIFFEEMTGIIIKYNGVIDKYVGDCVMAFWNVPNRIEHHELQACLAALECIDSMDHNPPRHRLKGRVGMESGQVFAGMVGSHYRLNYTLIGDVVTIAGRLQSLSRQFDSSVVIGPTMFETLKDQLTTRRLPAVQMELKGKPCMIGLHEVRGLVDGNDSRASATENEASPMLPNGSDSCGRGSISGTISVSGLSRPRFPSTLRLLPVTSPTALSPPSQLMSCDLP